MFALLGSRDTSEPIAVFDLMLPTDSPVVAAHVYLHGVLRGWREDNLDLALLRALGADFSSEELRLKLGRTLSIPTQGSLCISVFGCHDRLTA